jgi:hypothetical protein
VPRLDFVPQQPLQSLLDLGSTTFQGVQTTTIRVVTSEGAVTSERYLVLVVVSPDGKEIESHLIKDEALLDLQAFFAKLPENHYKIYLVRTETNTRRLVIDVFVRRYFDRVLREWRGRIVDPNDVSEGTRDKPPTSESALPVDNAVPLDENPLLEPLSQNGQTERDSQLAKCETSAAANEAPSPPFGRELRAERQPPAPRFSRWSAPLAGLALGTASGRSWSQRLEAALGQADERAWQRLRRVGRQRQRLTNRAPETSSPRAFTDQLQ